MKGIILDKVGGTFTLKNTLTKPTPNRSQILVKSLVTSLNPMYVPLSICSTPLQFPICLKATNERKTNNSEGIQQATGMQVRSWPIVLGCDASGIVVETGEDVKKFEKGDRVYGNTRLGTSGYGTFQEFVGFAY